MVCWGFSLQLKCSRSKYWSMYCSCFSSEQSVEDKMLCHGLWLAVITHKWWLCWTSSAAHSGRNETILACAWQKKLLLHAAEPEIKQGGELLARWQLLDGNNAFSRTRSLHRAGPAVWASGRWSQYGEACSWDSVPPAVGGQQSILRDAGTSRACPAWPKLCLTSPAEKAMAWLEVSCVLLVEQGEPARLLLGMWHPWMFMGCFFSVRRCVTCMFPQRAMQRSLWQEQAGLLHSQKQQVLWAFCFLGRHCACWGMPFQCELLFPLYQCFKQNN